MITFLIPPSFHCQALDFFLHLSHPSIRPATLSEVPGSCPELRGDFPSGIHPNFHLRPWFRIEVSRGVSLANPIFFRSPRAVDSPTALDGRALRNFRCPADDVRIGAHA